MCVCVHHDSIELMLNEINIQHLIMDTDMMLKNYHACLDAILCPDSSSSCHSRECKNCPGTRNLKNNIISDNLAHDTVAIHESQKIIVDYLKTHSRAKKIDYFTDVAGPHSKNESSFANLQAHEDDFGILAE